ncbi:MAG TPA: hypothetical protein VF538_17550 [Pyrinomonadaceae bacterium]|jgi:hypothetical protein
MRQTTNTPAAPVADLFVPIHLVQPDPASLAPLRTQIGDSDQPLEIAVRLSSQPHPQWIAMYVRLWSLYFPDVKPPIVAPRALRIASSPAKLATLLQIARVVVAWTNDLSAPLVRGEAAQIAAEQKRMRALDEFYARPRPPVKIAGKSSGDESAALALIDAVQVMARREFDAELVKLQKQIALEEIEDAIKTLAAA